MSFSGGGCEIKTQPSRRWHKFEARGWRACLVWLRFQLRSQDLLRIRYAIGSVDAIFIARSFAIRTNPLYLFWRFLQHLAHL